MPDSRTPESAPKPPAGSDAKGCWLAVLLLAGGVGGLVLLMAIVNFVWHSLSSGYNAITIPPGDVSDGTFWGIYGVYAVIVALEFTLLDGFDVVTTLAGRLVLVCLAIAAIVAPLVILLIPQHLPAGGSLPCGSWLSPSRFGMAGLYCAPPLDGESRNALTVMAVAFALPLLLMSLRVWVDWSDARKQGNPTSGAAGRS